MDATFKVSEGTRNLSRIIIRTLESNVDQIKEGNVTIHNSADQMSLMFKFLSNNDCVVAINFQHSDFNAQEKAIIDNATKIRVSINELRGESRNKRGFKIDIFVKKP